MAAGEIAAKFERVDELDSQYRTKQGLEAARAQGKVLGQPKGSKNKRRVLDPFRAENLGYLRQGLSIASIRKLINPKLDKPATYNTYRYYVRHKDALRQAWAEN